MTEPRFVIYMSCEFGQKQQQQQQQQQQHQQRFLLYVNQKLTQKGIHNVSEVFLTTLMHCEF